MLLCSDETIYTGYTTNLSLRIQQHNSGKGAKYTRTRTPVKLSYVEICSTQQEAMQREKVLKKIPRKKKMELITAFRSELLQSTFETSSPERK